jgi:acyl carrier protein
MEEMNSPSFEKFAGIVAKSLHIEPSAVVPSAHLDDLGAESLDLLEITMETEEAFNIWISEKSILQSATEVMGANVLEKDGVLTATGKALLLDRMPELDPATLAGEVSMTTVNKMFLQVGAWVRMIDTLMAETPRLCPHCTGAFQKAVAFRMKCSQCGVETTLQSGEDLNKRWVLAFRDKHGIAGPAAAADLTEIAGAAGAAVS